MLRWKEKEIQIDFIDMSMVVATINRIDKAELTKNLNGVFLCQSVPISISTMIYSEVAILQMRIDKIAMTRNDLHDHKLWSHDIISLSQPLYGVCNQIANIRILQVHIYTQLGLKI